MSNPTANSALRLLVEKLRDNPHFMAFVLDQFCKQEGMSAEELPEALEIMPEMVTRLALCRKPDPNGADFAERVREIAYYTLGDEAILANVIRRVNSIQSLSSAEEEAFLAAARDSDLEDTGAEAPGEEDEKDQT